MPADFKGSTLTLA